MTDYEIQQLADAIERRRRGPAGYQIARGVLFVLVVVGFLIVIGLAL